MLDDEFYRVALRKTLYRSLAELQADRNGVTAQTFLDAAPLGRQKMLPAA